MYNGPQTTGAGGEGYGTATDRANEIYDQLLTVGKEVAAAYVDAYEKTATGIAEFQNRVAQAGYPGIPGASPRGATRAGGNDSGEPVRNARLRAHEIGERLQEMNKKITLAYLNACELAALAVADCQEELSATSRVDLVKTMGGARADFRREIAKAYVSAARGIVG